MVDDEYVKQLEEVISKMLSPLKDIPLKIVIKSLSGYDILDFDITDPKDKKLLDCLIQALKNAMQSINNNGIHTARPNEAGNAIEPYVKDELTKLGCNAHTPNTLSGKVPDFEAELNQANIYISNSYHEGFNLPLIEAEAHSLPVLARSGTAMDELVKDGYNGYLFNDINEVPELVDKIMKNYKQMSYNAWKHSQNYTYERFKQNYLKILKEYKRGIK